MTSLQFLLSAAQAKDFPAPELPEIALAGRSNSGKSSFLNYLSELRRPMRKPLAKVSQVPGKTRLINFFEVPKKMRWVDLPGYGYAKRSGSEQETWGPVVEQYLGERACLVGVILLIDVRRDWEDDEQQLKRFLDNVGVPLCVVLTKADQITKAEIAKRLDYFLRKSQKPVFVVSNSKRTGGNEVDNFCYQEWVKTASKREEGPRNVD